MKSKYLLVALVILGAGVCRAQGFFSADDPQLYLPNVFIIVDTSGSMTWGSYPPFMSPVNSSRNRAESSIEILTGSYLTNKSCSGGQKQNGILDLYAGKIRFGFGSFDADGNGCGYDTKGKKNCWDYGDDTGTKYRLGLKDRDDDDNCNTFGEMIDVVDPNNPDDLVGNNNKIQNTICGLSFPYCTPLGAALYDARYYFEHYPADIPDYDDPQAECRQNFILLFTDGQENQGSRRYETLNASCPDGLGDPCGAVAQAWQACESGVPVFVVGFGNAGLVPLLNRIAHAGTHATCSPVQIDAFVADQPALIFAAFQAIMDAILAGTSSRTEVASTPSRANTETSYAYSASFDVSLGGGWLGSLKRIPVIDSDNDGIPEMDTGNAIDFADILAAQNASSRHIYTVVENPRSWGLAYPGNMPRPVDNSNPATGLYPLEATKTASNPDMCIQPTSEAICTSTTTTAVCSAYDQVSCSCGNWNQCNCSNGYLCYQGLCHECWPGGGNCWGVWLDRFELTCTDTENVTECTNWAVPNDAQLAAYVRDYIRGTPGTTSAGGRTTRTGPELGDIFHSNPVVATPPSALAPNYKYEAYHVRYQDRPTMVYVGANDGMLHAFVAEDPHNTGREGQELWGFVPNNLLPKLQKLRQGHEFFVDGTPVVRDLFLPSIQATDKDGHPMFSGAKPVMGAYRTVLVSGERGGGDAYFALDVTDPDHPEYLWEYRTDFDPQPNYDSVQCEDPRLQTWAKPIIGEVKLHNAHAGDSDPFTGEPQPEYVIRPVVIVPGGYLPPQSLLNVTSCVDFAEKIAAASAVHVLDAETGRLLRKFQFASSLGTAGQQCLDDYHQNLQTDPTQSFTCTFKSDDWSGGNGWGWGNNNPITSDGWFCREDRDQTGIPPTLPAELLQSCQENETDEYYRKDCCLKKDGNSWQGVPFDQCNTNAVGWCHYSYVAWKDNNSVQVGFKGKQCDGGSFNLQVGENFMVETSSASPVAYDTSLGGTVTRVFVPTTIGKIWRIDLRDAEYDYEKPEGEMVYAYNVAGVTHDWDVSRDNNGDAIPWFDTLPYTNGVRRPITSDAALAMNHKHNLVLFFGTGRIDDLRYLDTKDYVFAVEETRSEDTNTGFYVPDPVGKLFCDASYGPNCTGSGMPMELNEAERIFGKPLVVSSRVFFTTFEPSDDVCSSGTGRLYGYRYDDFNQQIILTEKQGIVRPPQIIWSSRGPIAASGTGGEIEAVGSNQGQETLVIGAKIMHWARVL